MQIRILLLLTLLTFSFSVSAQKVYEDRVFEENIQSVRLFPRSGEFAAQMNSPVIELNSGVLNLTFDDLAYDPDMYSVKVVHCNFDWTPSDLKEPEYLNEYNEFNILDYNYSIDTRVPYIHYNFVTPRVTKSGNYVLIVYRGRDQNKVVLTKRFMVFEKIANMAARVVPPSQTENRRQVQQININLNYKARELFDPKNNLRVMIRQNQRWDNSRVLGNPTMIREDTKMLEYQLFDGSNVFWGGNEFRFVDLRFVRAKGMNIAWVRMEDDIVYAEAVVDKPRPQGVYSEYLDMNGQFAIMNLERQNHERESEYMLVTFNLAADNLKQTPYIIGAFTQWGNEPSSKMVLDKKTNTYQATLLLKQGWYDYQYAFKTDDGWDMSAFEGNYFETENEYEVFVYYRDMASRYDELISYLNLNPNKRRL
ncbi:type IX secretion system plug protein domain-containing protein [Aquiflexum sp.]|uniref:type IX secretion system plug protein n=1 Tax=Aquiflexum sp. TaxID=1872584 RepID=UPI00359488F3